MPNPNALVDRIRNLSPSAETFRSREAQPSTQLVTVNFQGGRVGRLDMRIRRSSLWAKRLDFLRQNNMPAYVEIDPQTNLITEMLVPDESRVLSLTTKAEGDVEVKLIPSQALHYLRRDNPNFEELQGALQSAMNEKKTILVTRTRYEPEIIDVRYLATPSSPPKTGTLSPRPDASPIDPSRAQELFNLMNARSCDCRIISPCIPFKYPRDGCYARAHEMCRIMFEEEEVPGKVWICGSLNVKTSNAPDCEVSWWYHVAPTVLVTTSSGSEPRVIDPSLCDDPVSVEDWKSKQGDLNPTLYLTNAKPFWPPFDHYCGFIEEDKWEEMGLLDPDYSKTNNYLQARRYDLEDNCEKYGAPPYSCPITKRSFLITDRSTFGEDEVAAMLEDSTPAIIGAAFYVVVDGFHPAIVTNWSPHPDCLGITSATLIDPPNIAPEITMSPEVPGMTVKAVHLDMEDESHLPRRQRLTWTYQVEFTNTDGFTDGFIDDIKEVTLTASIASVTDSTVSVSSSAIIYLIKQPNPYEIDGSTSWLSTDLRVFQIEQGQSRFGVTMGGSATDASNFIKQVINNLNTGSGGETFEDISTNQQTSKLEISEQVDGKKVFNFAVARVRYRAKVQDAENVRVFFRLFPVSTTSLAYDESITYRSHERGGVKIPLLGVRSGRLVTIPCFAERRIDSSTNPMTEQTDPANVRTIPHDASGNERQVYFGCWLDINQLQPLFPLIPVPMDGPFPSPSEHPKKTIQELIRGQHQCLVAEIAFDLAPIPEGSTPGQSDKLAQRNLAIVESDNPGKIASHRIPLTFEIQPTSRTVELDEIPDELMIDWGNIPDGSIAKIYLPGINSAEVCSLATGLYKSHRLTGVDEHTVQCPTGGITYLPIPDNIQTNLAGLLSVDLPESVRRDQAFTIIVRQITTAFEQTPVVIAPRTTNLSGETAATIPPLKWRRILGSFQLTIPVRTKEVLLEPELRQLSVLRWIQKAIPEDDIWFPVFQRYVGQIAGRVDAFGGDSSGVVASPSGDWQGVQAKRCWTLAIISTLFLAILIVALGIVNNLIAVTTIAVFLAAIVWTWLIQCQPKFCRLVRALVLGTSSGVLILLTLALLGVYSSQLIAALVMAVILAIISGVIGTVRNCW